MKHSIEILKALCEYQSIELTFTECKEALQDIENNMDNDFYIELQGYEFRIILNSEIEYIWESSLIEQIQECYDLDNLPPFIEIDWSKTAQNCMVDGKGHHFSSYDGSEFESVNYDYFLTNA